jgi:hypothetical protein
MGIANENIVHGQIIVMRIVCPVTVKKNRDRFKSQNNKMNGFVTIHDRRGILAG